MLFKASGDLHELHEGWFQKNARNGPGRTLYKTGDIYEGGFLNNEWNGHGVFKYSYGDIYDGEWRDNLRHGKAVFKFFKTGAEETGQWLYDK